MKPPYQEKVGRQGSITIWLVDADYVRSNLDEEFTNFGQHYRYKFIPENEFWLDKETNLDERQFFIDHLLLEHRLMKQGGSYDDALTKADRKEKSERKRAGKIPRNPRKNRGDAEKTHLQLIGKTSDVNIWLVDSELVRDLFDIDFTEGGHDIVYNFVPKNEVWIDNEVTPEERPFIIFHELHERSLMKKGTSYEDAHSESSHLEYHLRHRPNELDEALKKEMEKN